MHFPKLLGAFLLGSALAVSGCSSSSSDDAENSAAATASEPSVLVAPQIASGGRYWDALTFQNDPNFDGVIAVGRQTPDGDPEQLVYIEQKSGTIGFFTVDGSDAQWEDTRQSLSDVSDRLLVMAGDAEEHGVALADFQGSVADHACMIRYVATSLAAVGVVLAADFTIGAAPAMIAAVQEQGLQDAALAGLRAAAQNPRVRAIVALKVAKLGVKAWLIFSDRGKKLTAPLRQAITTVVHAECTPSSAPPDEPIYVMP